MTTYYIADDPDFYGSSSVCVFDMAEIERLAEGWEKTVEQLMDECEIREATDAEIAEYADDSDVQYADVYVARVSNDNTDDYRAYETEAEADDKAEDYKAHLTANELKTNTVSVECYRVPCADGWNAERAYKAALLADLECVSESIKYRTV